jgi:hypothetical protein
LDHHVGFDDFALVDDVRVMDIVVVIDKSVHFIELVFKGKFIFFGQFVLGLHKRIHFGVQLDEDIGANLLELFGLSGRKQDIGDF